MVIREKFTDYNRPVFPQWIILLEHKHYMKMVLSGCVVVSDFEGFGSNVGLFYNTEGSRHTGGKNE